LAGCLDLVVFVAFYSLRVPAEERRMLDSFGDRYRAYTSKVGGIIPKP
jgi:protein-S-isoprenylcysteine O-methyltransferase Ste14